MFDQERLGFLVTIFDLIDFFLQHSVRGDEDTFAEADTQKILLPRFHFWVHLGLEIERIAQKTILFRRQVFNAASPAYAFPSNTVRGLA